MQQKVEKRRTRNYTKMRDCAPLDMGSCLLFKSLTWLTGVTRRCGGVKKLSVKQGEENRGLDIG